MDPLAPYQLSDSFIQKLQDRNALQEELQAGKSLGELVSFSEEAMQHFYEAAYQLYQSGRDKEAADAFFFLCTLHPAVQVYWLGLGMAEQCLNRFEEALSAYAMASLLEPQDPLPYYHSAACYHALQDAANARKSLEMALDYFGDDHDALKATARAALTAL